MGLRAPAASGLRVGRSKRALPLNVAHQSGYAIRPSMRDDGGSPDIGRHREHRLDFVKLDPDSRNLHLTVEAPDELDYTVGSDPRPVTGPIPASLLPSSGIYDELLMGEFG